MRMILVILIGLASVLHATAQTARPEQAEKVSWPSIVCGGVPFVCNKLNAEGYLFTQPGDRKLVLITHGSQGIDRRMYDYVDALRANGMAALVIDHWRPRGIGVTHHDYASASLKGGNEFNMAADSLTAAHWLRQKGFDRVGSIGESQGGSAAVMLQQKFANALVERNVQRLYANDTVIRPVDVVVGMYGYCGYRNAKRDAYVATPILLITGEVDDETPSKYCERHVSWMNDRGGNARVVVLAGEGHSFDAPYKRLRNPDGPHYAKCDVLLDENGMTELNSGEKMPGENVGALMAKCVSKGYHTGYWKDRFIAVPIWTRFFNDNL